MHEENSLSAEELIAELRQVFADVPRPGLPKNYVPTGRLGNPGWDEFTYHSAVVLAEQIPDHVRRALDSPSDQVSRAVALERLRAARGLLGPTAEIACRCSRLRRGELRRRAARREDEGDHDGRAAESRKASRAPRVGSEWGYLASQRVSDTLQLADL